MATPRKITRQHSRQRLLSADETREHPDIEYDQSQASFLPMASRPQMEIGHYHLIDEIGRGAFGAVYKARHKKNGSGDCYAIKILHSGFSPKDHRRFQQEARILQELRHPSLPRFIEQGITAAEDGFDRAPYLVMEFIAGKTLRDQPRLTQDITMRWCYELADALRYLHNHDIVHCDLKPTNVMIADSTAQGRSVRILDLGIALFGRPATSECIGSLPYMSPELFKGETISKAADIYALGLIVWELLTGHQLYQAPESDDTGQWRKIHLQEPPNLPENPVVPRKLREIIRQSLAKDPAARPDAEEFCEVLAREIYGIGIPGYIGIFGIPASGKTCYLLSLCHRQEVSQETREQTEDRYIDLYQKGVLPEATSLSSGCRLNFSITTAEKYYNIVISDYAGELLRMQCHDSLVAREHQIFQEKRQDLYQFLQRTRGILVVVENAIGSRTQYSLSQRNPFAVAKAGSNP